jgi:hypothetical protein
MEWNLFVAYLISNASKNIYNQEMCYITFLPNNIFAQISPHDYFKGQKITHNMKN